jgi:hypothetical protein
VKSAQLFALAAVFAAESALFCVVTSHRYAWICPRWNDQVQYLQQAYDGYEQAQRGGFLPGMRQALSQGSAQGSLHGFLALMVFEAVGPSRMAALSLNLTAFLALQAATFLAVRRLSGSLPIAWASIALLASLHFPWSGAPGSAIDFRLDWMAACAYGVALAAAIAGKGFCSTRWAVLFGAMVGAVVMLRFLTAAYFGLIFIVLLFWLLTQPDRWSRCGRLSLSAIVALGLCGPAIWLSRLAIFSYYWIGHFTGPERALRDSHLGFLQSAKWLFSILLTEQIGLLATALGIAAAVALIALGAIRRFRIESPLVPINPLGSAWVLAFVFFSAPAAVLVLHAEKASQTVSILIPGAVWMVVLAEAWLARRVERRAVASVCGMMVLAASIIFIREETTKRFTESLDAEYRQINAMSDYFYYRAEESGLKNPRVAVTWILDSVGAGALTVIGYERHHRLLQFIPTLPTGLLPTTRDVAMKGISESDFVCLVTRAAAVWPFDFQMAELAPEMRRWCDGNLRHVGDLNGDDFSASIYERTTLARPSAGSGVALEDFMGAALRRPAYADAVPPAAPAFPLQRSVLGSTKAEFHYALAAAYSPVRYSAISLPAGLRLDLRSGEIRGRFPRAGVFPAKIAAANTAGSSVGELEFQIDEAAFFAVLNAPKTCKAGVPVDVDFGAFDVAGKLDFIDVADMSARKLLDRLPAPGDQKERWQGSYRLSLDRPGPRIILMRFARFDGAAREHYSFVDRQFTIDVEP